MLPHFWCVCGPKQGDQTLVFATGGEDLVAKGISEEKLDGVLHFLGTHATFAGWFSGLRVWTWPQCEADDVGKQERLRASRTNRYLPMADVDRQLRLRMLAAGLRWGGVTSCRYI